jgi:hypothetical protein
VSTKSAIIFGDDHAPRDLELSRDASIIPMAITARRCPVEPKRVGIYEYIADFDPGGKRPDESGPTYRPLTPEEYCDVADCLRRLDEAETYRVTKALDRRRASSTTRPTGSAEVQDTVGAAVLPCIRRPLRAR